MTPYEQEHEFIVDQLRFAYSNAKWSGSGLVRWHPDTGYRIHVSLTGKSYPGTVVVRGSDLIREGDRGPIWMHPLHSSGWAVAPDVLLKDRFDVLISQVLDARVGRLIFSEPTNATRGEHWTCSCTIAVANRPLMPDAVHRQHSIASDSFDEGRSKTGINYTGPDGQRVVGARDEDGELQLQYSLPVDKWSAGEAWRWADGARDALGIILCQQPVLLERAASRHMHRYIDRRVRSKPVSARPFALTDTDPIVTRERFVHLANFLTRRSKSQTVAINLYRQFTAGVGQRNWQAKELLIATALEASLRTWRDRPFRAKDSFNVGKECDLFISELFPGKEWKTRATTIERAYFLLRDRNAHPDWLFAESDGFNDRYREDAYRAMQLLGQFYGYVILRLSGITDLEPRFARC